MRGYESFPFPGDGRQYLNIWAFHSQSPAGELRFEVKAHNNYNSDSMAEMREFMCVVFL
jgi:hypothetical protein